MIWLKSQPISPETRRAHIRVIKDFFNWFYTDPLYEPWTGGKRNPAERIEIPSPERRAPRAFNIDLLPTLFRASAQGAGGARDKAIIMLMLEGLRRGEILGLRLGDVDFAKRLVRVFGKGRKERLVPMSSVTAIYVRAWMSVRPRYVSDAVFVSLHPRNMGKPLTVGGLRALFRRWKDRAHIDIMNPHSFRHCFASEYIAAGGDARSLADILGHEDPDFTLERYVHFNATRLAEIHNRYAITRKVADLLRRKEGQSELAK